jgi:hypothetical protein
MKARRYFRTLPPSQTQVEVTLWASELPMDDLIVAHEVILAELDQRQGRAKYRLPDHVEQMLN